MLLDVEEYLVGDVTVFRLTGKLALGRENVQVEAIAERLTRDGHKKMIFDIMGVTYIDSVAIGTLAMSAKKVKEAGGRLALVSPPEGRTTRILKLTQIGDLLPLCTSLEEALAVVGQA